MTSNQQNDIWSRIKRQRLLSLDNRPDPNTRLYGLKAEVVAPSPTSLTIAHSNGGGGTDTAMELVASSPAALIPQSEISNQKSDIAKYSQEEEIVARQKAQFVMAVWEESRLHGITINLACHNVASDTTRFFHLQSAEGKNLLAGRKAWHNYRSWTRALGQRANKKPNVDNWSKLLPKYRGSRPYQRPGDPEFWILLARGYENDRGVKLRCVYRYAVMTARAANIVDIPTFHQVSHFYKYHTDKKAVLIARNGIEWALNNLVGHISRNAADPDVCWFSDHHIFDVPIRIQDEQTGEWRPVRPWITTWMDWGTHWFHGVIIRAITPNRDSIERALREGIESNDYRPPCDLYVDNGKDYQSTLKRKELLLEDEEARVKSVATLLGCKVHFAIPYNAKAKPVEREFGTICNQFSKLCPGYLGNSPENRPESAHPYWKNPLSLLTLEEFTSKFHQWLNGVYYKNISIGNALKGKSPLQARATMTHPRMPLDENFVKMAFLREVDGRFRTIMRGGVVQAYKQHYQSDVLWRLLGNQKRVVVKLDPDNVKIAHIFTEDGRHLGTANQVKRIDGLIDHDDVEKIEELHSAIAKNRGQLKELKAASAANRGLTHFSKSGFDMIGQVFPCTDVHTCIPAPRSKRQAPPEPSYATADDIAALDEALREETLTNRAARANDFDDFV